jgi:hypothetical protein
MPFTGLELMREAVERCREKQAQAMERNAGEQLSQLLDHEHRLLELLLQAEKDLLRAHETKAAVAKLESAYK